MITECNGGCLIISDGVLPLTTASSCWTRPPRVGSSSRWSRATRGDPSTVSSWRPGVGGVGRETEIVVKNVGKGADGRGVDKVKHGRAWSSRQGWATNTNKYSLWFHSTGVQTCFHCYCISGTNTVGGIFTVAILWMKSWQEQRSSPAFPSVLLFSRHNNYCCYPLIPGKKK